MIALFLCCIFALLPLYCALRPTGTHADTSTVQKSLAHSTSPTYTYTGMYQHDDAVPVVTTCRSPNPFTGNCSCQAFSTVLASIRVLVERDKSFIGSNIFLCGFKNEVQRFVGSATSAAAYDIYTGVFQFDDKNVCLSKNPAADACTCDASSVKLTKLRAIVDDGLPGSFKGSNIQSCGAAASASDIALSSDLFQVTGMYQLDDPVDKSEGCRSINQFTGNCSCRAGDTDQQFRALVDVAPAGSGYIGSNIHACYRPPPPPPPAPPPPSPPPPPPSPPTPVTPAPPDSTGDDHPAFFSSKGFVTYWYFYVVVALACMVLGKFVASRRRAASLPSNSRPVGEIVQPLLADNTSFNVRQPGAFL